ncbi:tyrosine-type recombinase/integrase [Solilutibacter silvestris]|uniref:Site-specific recombinase XerD n=1 Tax=Solilutibacter silvestris TaxID=1645665 RepID=A0A2K1Q1G8_9GAMM|nr:tyrosine-type recombinase/integrase [Lysobacter silvestris]PNS08872.1 Site-specific recombinase XerD [Lysobacter silvestris]
MTATILPFGQAPLAQAANEVPVPTPEEAREERRRRARKAKQPTVLPLQRPPRDLTEAEMKLQTQMLDGYFVGHRGARRHTAKTVQRDRRHAEEFLAYAGQPIWACTSDDFESWCSHLSAERKLKSKTQRGMQTAVSTLYDYLVTNRNWQNQVHALCGERIEQVVTVENRIVHVTDDGEVTERYHMDAQELDAFFRMIDILIEIAGGERKRLLKTLQRDKAMFCTYYAYGLRLSEGHKLDMTSFRKNPDLPELGRYGFAGVYGKGSRGSGPKFRMAPPITPAIPSILDWYLEEIRPKFAVLPGHESAMWLSEVGKRLCRASIWGRYKFLIRTCGLDEKLFSTHGLRHMFASHQSEADVPMQFTSKSMGHVHGSTTARYTHLSDKFLRNVAVNVIRRDLYREDET